MRRFSAELRGWSARPARHRGCCSPQRTRSAQRGIVKLYSHESHGRLFSAVRKKTDPSSQRNLRTTENNRPPQLSRSDFPRADSLPLCPPCTPWCPLPPRLCASAVILSQTHAPSPSPSDSASISATSTTGTSAPVALTASPTMIRQNGQATATVDAPVSSASWTRPRPIRSSGGSSNHIRPPPAPQQAVSAPRRRISFSRRSPNAAPSTSRGAAVTPWTRAR